MPKLSIYILYYAYVFTKTKKILLVSTTEEVGGGKTVGALGPLHHIPKCSPDWMLQTLNLDLFKLTAALVEQTATYNIIKYVVSQIPG